jgi:hypothetical protein
MDKPTLRVLHGVPTTPVRLDRGLTPDDLGRFDYHRAEQPRRVIRSGSAVRHLYQAIVTVLAAVRAGRPRRPVSPVVVAGDRTPL